MIILIEERFGHHGTAEYIRLYSSIEKAIKYLEDRRAIKEAENEYVTVTGTRFFIFDSKDYVDTNDCI